MPIPRPGEGETERDFISRCIEAISGEYETDQAAAICHRQFREGKSMSKHQALIEAIKARKGSGEFGYGITSADRYVAEAAAAVGNAVLMKHFHCLGQNGVERLIKRACDTLTICDQDTATEKMLRLEKEKAATSMAEMKNILGCDPPEHSMIAMINRLTTPSEDRDGDTLQTKGARLDPKSPLLWQHIHTLPIGKMVRIVEHTDKLLKVATVLLDLNELTSDAGKLFEAGALRFSHGFIAKEFEERKGKSDSGGVPRFNITLFDIVEESAVSVPSNTDAEVELFCRGKLTSDVFKAHAKSLFDARNKSMPVTAETKAAMSAPSSTTPSTSSSSSKATGDIVRKMFDVATQRVEPSNMEYDWAARFIGCSVKDLHVHSTACSGMLIGAFLEGLEVACSEYKCQDTRNLDGEKEQPPVFEPTDIDSENRKTFLIEGIRFFSGNGVKLVARVWKGWGSQSLVVYSEGGDAGQKLIDDTWKWLDLNNPLKGQAFSLAGQWIKRTGTDWPDVFLEKDIEESLRRTVRIINEKGVNAANKGILMSGPPGTGKTLSARVMLNKADCTFIWVSPRDFYAGCGFTDAFSMARSLAPAILMFEDVDNWISDYTIDLIKTEMDGLSQSSGVTTVMTTNFPDQLPAALVDRPGRFHDVLEIHLPTREVRLRMLQKWAAGATLDKLAELATDLDGYSGAHLYELCHFAKVLSDEDNCSLDESLTKAFAKVKDQRDLINQNQLAGSSYRPGRRELQNMIAKGWTGTKATMPREQMETKLDKPVGDMTMGGPVPANGEAQATFMERCMLDSVMMDQYPTEVLRQQACTIQFGKAATLATKQMGECKECGEKAMLNEDGMCKDCAAAEGDEEDAPKSGQPTGTKSGRVLSRKNRERLEDALGDIEAQHKIMELPRDAKALNRAAHGKVKEVVDSSTVLEAEPPTVDHVLREAMSHATEDRAFRDRLRKGLDLLDKADESEQLAEDFLRLEDAMSSSG